MNPATIAGLLADGDRLRVFAAVALGARTLEEITTAGGVDADTARAGLTRLVAAGVIEQQDGFRVSAEALRAAARERPPRNRELPGALPDQANVLRNFVEGGRLRALPVRAAQRRVVLEYLAGRFEPEVQHAEAEVNEKLQRFHDDYASLRRCLVDEGLLSREGGVYRRPA
jgi:hypothetical protein